MKCVLMFACAAAFALTGASACSPNACSDAESHCVDAHDIESCEGSVDAVGQSRHSSTRACPSSKSFCVTLADSPNGAGNATCAASADKSPECDTMPNGSKCKDGAVEACNSGYLIETNACDASESCVEVSSSQAECALSSSKDPACPSGPGTTSVCDADGGTSITCYGGYAISKQSCGDAGETCNAETGSCL